MKCATHPEVETNLRCGKCGKLICPKCLVQTPVGARCTDCARLYKVPTYDASARYYLKAIGVALGMAIVGGVAWAVVNVFLPGFLDLLMAPVVGYGIGEVVSLSVNRKRGRGLAAVAGVGVIISFLVSVLLFGGLILGLFSIVFGLVAVALGIFFAANRLF